MDSSRPPKPRNALRTTLVVLLVLVIGAAAVYAAKVYSQPAETAAKETTAAAPVEVDSQAVDLTEKQAATLKVSAAEEHVFETLKTAVGTVDFNEDMNVQVYSQYPGKILKASYNIGDDVKAGDILFTIDSPDLLQAESTLLAAAGVLELQTRTLARVNNLVRTGGAAQKDVDQSTSDQMTAEGNFKAAKDAVRIFGKTDAEIDDILSKRKVDSTLLVPSPITGRIIARNAAPGFLTQPGTPPAPYSVADISTMWMLANVIEADAPYYKLGQEIEVSVPAYPGRILKGRVTTLGANIDPTTHRQLVRSQIADPDHLLRPGMFASFIIRMGDAIHSTAVPEEGVVREGDGTMTVWVTTDRRHFAKRVVKIGLRQDGLAQILDGLKPGEQVVGEGAVFLTNKLLLGAGG